MLDSLKHLLQVLLAPGCCHKVCSELHPALGAVVDYVDGAYVLCTCLECGTGRPVVDVQWEERRVNVQLVHAKPAV